MPSKISLGAVIAAIFIVGAAMVPSANAASPDDACSLLTPVQVSAALSVPVGAGAYQGTYKKTCTWNTTGNDTKGAKFVTLVLEGLDAYQGGKLVGQMKTISVTSISGIGDDAYYLGARNNVGLIVKKGNVAFRSPCTASYPLKKSRLWRRRSPSKSCPSSDVPR